MSILSKKSFAPTARTKFRERTAAVSRLRAKPTTRTIRNRACAKRLVAARTFRSAHFETNSAKRIRFQRRRNRAAQSAERRSCRAAAKLDRRIARCSGSQHSRRRRKRRHFRNRSHIHSAGRERRTTSGNFALGKYSRAHRLASRQTKRSLDLFDLKGALESVVPNLSFRPGKFPDLALPVEICSGEQMIGFGGQLSAAKSNAPGPVFVAELHADLLLKRTNRARNFARSRNFPPSRATSR